MSDGEGWIQRVFGGKPGSQRTQTPEDAIAERDRAIAERDRAIAEREQRLAALDGELGSCNERSRQREAELARRLEDAAGAHEALAAELERSESSRAAEFSQARKQLDSVQNVLQGVREELASTKARLAAREAELARKAELLTDSEWRNQTLEAESARARAEEPKRRALEASASALQRELEAVRAEHARQEARLEQLQSAEQARLEQLAELERSQGRAGLRIEELEAGLGASEGLLRDREARLTQLRGALLELARLSAIGLHGAFGEALHLGLELSASRGWRPGVEPAHELSALAAQIRKRLSLCGLVDELQLASSGPELRGELQLSGGIAATELRALSRWAAAYAIECANLALPAVLRLDAVHDTPRGCTFNASPRAATATEPAETTARSTRDAAQSAAARSATG